MNAKSLQFQTFRKPAEVLQMIDKEIPAPAADEVIIRMIASPINPSDLLPVKGAYSHRIPLLLKPACSITLPPLSAAAAVQFLRAGFLKTAADRAAVLKFLYSRLL